MTGMTPTQIEIAKHQSEASFQSDVIQLARDLGWLVHHTHDSRSNDWSADRGIPDLLLARRGRFIGVELKRVGKKPDLHQRAWLGAMGGNGFWWTPLDLETLKGVLA